MLRNTKTSKIITILLAAVLAQACGKHEKKEITSDGGSIRPKDAGSDSTQTTDANNQSNARRTTSQAATGPVVTNKNKNQNKNKASTEPKVTPRDVQPSLVLPLSAADRKNLEAGDVQQNVPAANKGSAIRSVTPKVIPKVVVKPATINNPYLNHPNLVKMFKKITAFRANSPDAADWAKLGKLIATPQITEDQKKQIEVACMQVAEDPNLLPSILVPMKDRLDEVYRFMKIPALAEAVSKHLGNFQATYDGADARKKKLLLPLLYAFNVYNKIQGTTFDASQGPSIYTSSNFLTKKSLEIFAVSRVDLSADQDVATPLTDLNVKLLKATDAVIKSYYASYLTETQGLIIPLLTGYINERAVPDLANLVITEIKKANDVIATENPDSKIKATTVDGSLKFYAFPMVSDSKSVKNQRVEVILPNELILAQ